MSAQLGQLSCGTDLHVERLINPNATMTMTQALINYMSNPTSQESKYRGFTKRIFHPHQTELNEMLASDNCTPLQREIMFFSTLALRCALKNEVPTDENRIREIIKQHYSKNSCFNLLVEDELATDNGFRFLIGATSNLRTVIKQDDFRTCFRAHCTSTSAATPSGLNVEMLNYCAVTAGSDSNFYFRFMVIGMELIELSVYQPKDVSNYYAELQRENRSFKMYYENVRSEYEGVPDKYLGFAGATLPIFSDFPCLASLGYCHAKLTAKTLTTRNDKTRFSGIKVDFLTQARLFIAETKPGKKVVENRFVMNGTRNNNSTENEPHNQQESLMDDLNVDGNNNVDQRANNPQVQNINPNLSEVNMEEEPDGSKAVTMKNPKPKNSNRTNKKHPRDHSDEDN